MKSILRSVWATGAVILLAQMCTAQLLQENFDYPVGSVLTADGYTAHSGAGAHPVMVVVGSLSYPGYPLSAVGNSVVLTGGSGSREDVNRTFPAVSFGAVYASFLISVSAVSAVGDYFFHLGPSTVSTTFRGRVFARSDTAGRIAFGVSKSSSADSLIRWTPYSYETGTTYLVVLKYLFHADATNDDEVFLWVNPPLSGIEPTPAVQQTDTGTDIAEIGAVAYRQGSVSYTLTLDGVRVSTAWNDAQLPIELAKLTAVVKGPRTYLSWTTVSEINNYGFEVQKSGSRADNYVSISALIPGHGTTILPQTYSFVDSTSIDGHFYRLKEINLDQSIHYSEPVESVLSGVAEGRQFTFALHQNYPNPFNPSTTIQFTIVNRQLTIVKVYDVMGREVATLVNEVKEPGTYTVQFSGSGLASGVYFYRLSAGQYVECRKMVVMK